MSSFQRSSVLLDGSVLRGVRCRQDSVSQPGMEVRMSQIASPLLLDPADTDHQNYSIEYVLIGSGRGVRCAMPLRVESDRTGVSVIPRRSPR